MLELNKPIDSSYLFGSSFTEASPYGHLNADDLVKNDLFSYFALLAKDNCIASLLRKFKSFGS